MSLRQIRELYGMTQRQVADLVGVSQQTVARWEGAPGAEIPSKHLQDLSLRLGCRIDDLLREKPALRNRRAFMAARSDEERPYGTARIELQDNMTGDRVLEFPISRAEAHRIRTRLDPDIAVPWVNLQALNDRMLLIRLDTVLRWSLFDDDVEAMPEFEIPEVYAAFSDDRMGDLLAPGLAGRDLDDQDDYSPDFIERCRAVVTEWERYGPFGDVPDPTTRIVAETLMGERLVFDYSQDEVYAGLSRLIMALEDERALTVSPDAGRLDRWMLDLDPDGLYQATFVRLGALRWIQFSAVGYERAIDRSMGP